jgi:hypothetical protein
MLRYYVVSFTSYGSVSLDIKADDQVAILALFNKVTLVAFMLELHSGVMLGEPLNLNIFFSPFFNQASTMTRFTWVDYKVAMPRTSIAF